MIKDKESIYQTSGKMGSFVTFLNEYYKSIKCILQFY